MNQLISSNELAAHADPPLWPVTQPGSSIYHEPWWLDAATGGQWSEVTVREGDAFGRWPFEIQLTRGMMISRMSSLVHTLGPVISGLSGKPVTVWRRRTQLTRELIDALPNLAHFAQIFDPRVEDTAAFTHHGGFQTSSTHSFRIDAGMPIETVWSEMTDKTRNVIRAAARTLCVEPIDDIDVFHRFYDLCLEGRPNHHDPSTMRTLLTEIHDRGAGQFLGARSDDGQLAAAIAIVWDADAVRYFMASRLRARAGSGAVSLLIWESIQTAAARGLAFDFDGAFTPAFLMFLSGFGGRLVQRPIVWRTAPEYLPFLRENSRFWNGDTIY